MAEPDLGSAEKTESQAGRHNERRIIPIPGDIESETLAENKSKDVQTGIPMVASVKHYGSYDYFNSVNVEGTRHVYTKAVDAKVIHVGNLTSRALDYRFQPNYKQNAFLMRVKAILEFGLFPDNLMHLYSEFSPIDLTAEGVVKIAQYAGSQTMFRLNSNRPIYFDRFLEVVRGLGISMKVVDGDSFTQALRGTIRDRGTEYIFEAFQNDMDDQGRLMYDSNIHIENDFTVWFLKKLGFEWNKIDKEYIQGYVEYIWRYRHRTVPL